MRDEVVAGRSATIAVQLYSGETRTDSTTAVTVEVRRADGTVVLPAGTATTKPANTVGRYEATLTPAQVPDVDLLTATWSVALDSVAQTRQTTIEVIGANYFELAELRAMPGVTARHDAASLVKARTQAQDELERDIGVAFVERFGTATFSGRGRSEVHLRPYIRRVLGGSAAGVVFTAGDLATMVPHPDGLVVRTSGVFGTLGAYRDVVLRFVHGWSEEPPTDIHDAALELARHHLLGWRSFVPDEPVDADDLGRETVSAETVDRRAGQDLIASVIKAWRTRLLGSDELASVQIR